MDISTREARIGNHVREHRRRLGLSQTELARRVSVSRGTINRLEMVPGYQVTTAVCLRLAKALGIEASDLFYEECAS